MFSNIKTCTLEGLQGHIINVETDISRGMPKFSIVGLPDTAVKGIYGKGEICCKKLRT